MKFLEKTTLFLLITLMICSINPNKVLSQDYFSDEEGEYMIIVHDAFYQQILPLAQWKHEKGLKVEIGRISQIGSQPSQIKTYILDAYQNWSVSPEYILLVGDTEYVPMGDGSTDNYYADMEGDFHAELIVGRFSCDSADQCELLVAKNLGYEKPRMQINPEWTKSATLIVRDDYDEADATYYADTWHDYDFLIEAGYTTIDTLFAKNNDDANDIVNSVDAGRMIVRYRGQGVSNWWSPFDVSPYSTNNGFMLPFVLSATCGTGSFDDDYHVCEEWIRAGTPENPKGAIAFFGTSTVGSHVESVRSKVDRGFFKSVFLHDQKTLGKACLSAKEFLIQQLPGEVSEYKGWNLLGDPELYLWTDTLQEVSAAHLDIAPTGAFNFLIDVVDNQGDPIANAKVCLSKGEEVHSVGFTDENGHLDIPINATTVGPMNIVITGDYLYPYEDTIDVVANISKVQGYFINEDTNETLQYGKVFIQSTGQYAYSNEDGFYELYIAEEGFYLLEAELFGFYPYTYENFYVASDQVIDLDIQLSPKPYTILEGYIHDEETGTPITNVKIEPVNYQVTPVYSDASGYYIFPSIPTGYDYVVQAIHDQYTTKIKPISISENQNFDMDYELTFIEKFEESDGEFWAEAGSGWLDWEWGLPQAGSPPNAYSGEKIWGTNLGDVYHPNMNEYLYSRSYYLAPQKDLYQLSFFNWYETEEGWDGGNVQLSSDGGETWSVIAPNEGYPDQSVVSLGGQAGFTGSQTEWKQVKFDLSPYVGQHVIFRMRFATTNANDWRGWFIDDFTVFGAGEVIDSVNDDYSLDSPQVFRLEQNYPNPFNPTTTITFETPEKNAKFALQIYDVSGKLIKTLIDGEIEQGYHSIVWDGTDEAGLEVSSGLYFYRIETDSHNQIKSMLLLK